MNLPHELLDEILSYLPLDNNQDRWSLQNYSLVAKSWVGPCQRRLFETVEIREETLQSWRDTILPTDNGLLQHVRSLSYITDYVVGRGDGHLRYCVDVFRDYLLSFYQLQHPSLSFMSISSDISREVKIFSAFRHTLLRFSLDYCDITISALLTLINYFPSLDRLDLKYVSRKVDGELAPPPSRPLIRELHISELDRGGLGIFDQLSELGPAFDKVVIDGQSRVGLYTLSHVTGALGVNARHVGLLQPLLSYDTGNGTTPLSHCRELRQLELVVTYPGIGTGVILSSITSTNIQKVSLICQRHRLDWGLSWFDIAWAFFDPPLCQLIDKSTCTRELEVDVRIMDARDPERVEYARAMMMVDSLVGFREKGGQIRIVCVDPDGSESVIYPPTSTPGRVIRQ